MTIEETIEASKKILNRFGIDNLSNIEAWHLRKIAKQCDKEQIELIRLGRLRRNTSNVFDTEVEAAARWLNDLYGINYPSIVSAYPFDEIVIKNKKGKEFRYHYETQKEVAINKFTELYGFNFDGEDWNEGISDKKFSECIKLKKDRVIKRISPELKEYIRRLRDNAHLI